VIIDWPASLDAYLERLDADAAAGRGNAQAVRNYVAAALEVLQDLDGEPVEETATLKRVRQSAVHRVWRVAHPFNADVAVRLIAWFPPNSQTVVVALFAGDKKRIGDLWYDSVGVRADEAIRQWKFQTQDERLSDDDDQW